MNNRDLEDFLKGYMEYWDGKDIPQDIPVRRGYLAALDEVENGKIHEIESFGEYYYYHLNGYDISIPSQLKDLVVLRNQLSLKIKLLVRDYPQFEDFFTNIIKYEEKSCLS